MHGYHFHFCFPLSFCSIVVVVLFFRFMSLPLIWFQFVCTLVLSVVFLFWCFVYKPLYCASLSFYNFPLVDKFLLIFGFISLWLQMKNGIMRRPLIMQFIAAFNNDKVIFFLNSSITIIVTHTCIYISHFFFRIPYNFQPSIILNGHQTILRWLISDTMEPFMKYK